MYEGDASAVKADARLGVDQLEACRTGRQERGGDVGDAVRDVVKARSALRDELSHRRVLPQRRHELDLAIADAQQRGLEAFFFAGGAMNQLGAQRIFIEMDGFVEVRHCDADVMDAIRRAQVAPSPISPSPLSPSPISPSPAGGGSGWGVAEYRYQPSPDFRPSFPALTLASS